MYTFIYHCLCTKNINNRQWYKNINSDLNEKKKKQLIPVSISLEQHQIDINDYRKDVMLSAICLMIVILLVNCVFFYWCWYYPKKALRVRDAILTSSDNHESSIFMESEDEDEDEEFTEYVPA